ncbi:hypothetical protein [Litoribrevibacter albus]|uniref:DUF1311 domain-containing protein n=1 Tax=Litoribrevibacter albus TaxID=1473156 RepID=A0AA37S7Y9_9GAMM|nr:hypothetical protein [Litoribrevibacter albus]GLQ30832.1 hypothetical protein GCM10007876_13110 [Litoribrevibacter albus]
MKYLAFLLILIPCITLSKTYSELGAVNSIPPSFNCDLASTEIEKKICFSESSHDLGELDFFLGELFKITLKHSPDSLIVRRTQREWLKYRNEYYNRYDIGDEDGFECSRKYLTECYQWGISRLYYLIRQFPEEKQEAAYKEISEVEREMLELWGVGDRKENQIDDFFYSLQKESLLSNIGPDCTYATYNLIKVSMNAVIYRATYGRTCQGMGHSAVLRLACSIEGQYQVINEVELNVGKDYLNYEKEILKLNLNSCAQSS